MWLEIARLKQADRLRKASSRGQARRARGASCPRQRHTTLKDRRRLAWTSRDAVAADNIQPTTPNV
jgi:hypothetical protein